MKNKEKLHHIGILIVLSLVFLGLFLIGDYGISGDSESYLSMGVNREPIYPLILWCLQAIFGDGEGWYVVLAFLQNAFAVATIYATGIYMGRCIFRSNLGTWISSFILAVPHLMTPLFSRSNLVMTNKIMGEGISISLFYIFMIYIMKLIYEEEKWKWNAIISAFITAVMILTRGQLLVTIIVWFLVVLGRIIIKKQYKLISIPICGVFFVVLGTSLFTGVYHYIMSGVYTNTVSSGSMVVANVLYVAEESDGDYIEDPQVKQVFTNIYNRLEDDEMLAVYADEGLLNRALHHEDIHDTINFLYFAEEKNRIYNGLMGDNYTEYLLFEEELADTLTVELLKENWPRYLENYVAVCFLGFIRSVSVEQSIFKYFAAFIYIAGILAGILVWRKKGITKNVLFLLVTYISIAGFVTSTSLILQCITRYMIYNLPFFYLAGLATINDLWEPFYNDFKTKRLVKKEK